MHNLTKFNFEIYFKSIPVISCKECKQKRKANKNENNK